MYFDPGFGGMLLQIIVAIVAVGGGILFSLRRKLRNLFSKNDNKIENNDAPVSQITPDTEDDAVDMLDLD